MSKEATYEQVKEAVQMYPFMVACLLDKLGWTTITPHTTKQRCSQ